jgi:translation initiation factor IF-3
LRHKDKVKITIMFRGREVTHPERGVMILDRLAEELADYGVVEQRPIQDGRNMTMMLGPSKGVLSGEIGQAGAADADDAVAADAPDTAAPAPDAGAVAADAPEADAPEADAPEADAPEAAAAAEADSTA